jgi:glutamate/tyrosine decarboxylase-like PLP-dependent enzyme
MSTAHLLLDAPTRTKLWRRLADALETYASRIETHRVTPKLDPGKIRSRLARFDFRAPVDPIEALDFLVEELWQFQTHTPHPRYYGLFNPAPTTMGIAADTLAAAFNPQLAAWSHSPLAIEIEQHLLRALGARFGYDPAHTDGTFASGGMEANHTAVLTALTHAFPEYGARGTRALPGQPALYVSTEAHHSFHKAARVSGLGSEAVREIPVDHALRMDAEALASRLARDRREGFAPFLVAATAGTTNSGVVDPLARIGALAAQEKIWFHVDAAWGGAAALVPELRPLLKGVEQADSITFDAHKWLSVPMGAGVYLTRWPDILDRTFRTTAAYMPREAMGLDVVDPCMHSLQWSRRAIGLKVFLSLAVAGWEGYAAAIRHMVAMGDRLRKELGAAGWEVVNQTPLPLVCFVDRKHADGKKADYLDAVALEVVTSGKAWISTTRLAGITPVLRACITNYRTEEKDVVALVEALNWARDRVRTRKA